MKNLAALLPGLILLACGQTENPGGGGVASTSVETEADTKALAPASNAQAEEPLPTGDGQPLFAVPKLTPEAERGEKGARNVLLAFASAIERKKFGEAWDLLSAADKRKWSREAFAAIFADLGKISVAMPSGTMEGAAGSSYYTAPVTVSGSDTDGRPVRIEGKAVLRRANDVPGADPEQLRWHFETLTLDWTH